MRAALVAFLLAAGAFGLSGCGSAKQIQLRAIEVSQARNSALSIFPSRPGRTRCVVLANGITTIRLHGSCQTAVRWARNRHEPLLIVTFTERWPKPACPAGATCDNLGYFSRFVWVEPPTSVNGQPVVVATHSRGFDPLR